MRPVRKRPELLRALGAGDPPLTVVVGGRILQREAIFKHDFWAATGVYVDGRQTRVICKFNRQQPIYGLPMKWLGRWLARREAWFLRCLADIDGVPEDLGPVVVDDAVAENAVARAFVAGAPLTKFEPVGDDFFDRLSAIVTAMHDRGIAYVDLNKKENIIVGTDGRPHLIDFQVSFALPEGWFGRTWLLRACFSQLAAFDRFHIMKHVAACRPDLLNAEELERARTPPPLLRVHRVIARPLRSARRRLLVAMSVRSGRGLAETEVEPEDAVRRNRDHANRNC